jgi:DNA-binding NarL/FixJ family response regulator
MNIIIIDDDKLVSSSLKTIIETNSDIRVLSIGNNGKEAISLYEELKPDVLLMDIRMNTVTGLEAAEILTSKYPNIKILFLTTFADDEYIIKALKIGAKGYILKQNFESIIPALKAVNVGQTVFGEDIIAKIPNLFNQNKTMDLSKYSITDREYEIIKLICDGLSNKEIGNTLYISEGTVRNSISSILEKLTLRDRTQIAIFYYKNLKNTLT